VRQYALVWMRKLCGADDKHGADEKTLFCCSKCILNNPLFVYHHLAFLKNMIPRTTKNWQTLHSYFDSLNISTEKCSRS